MIDMSPSESLLFVASQLATGGSLTPDDAIRLSEILKDIKLSDFSCDCLTEVYGAISMNIRRSRSMRADVEREWRVFADRIASYITRLNTPEPNGRMRAAAHRRRQQ